MLVIRIRGSASVNYKIEDTMKMLRLHKPNHCVIVNGNKSITGMLKKVKDYVAYGEVDEETLVRLLRYRGLLKGNKKISNDFVKKNTNYKNIPEFADALMNGKIQLKDVTDFKPVFRLHPPRGGFRGTIKKPFNAGGVLGHVGNYINSLANKMI